MEPADAPRGVRRRFGGRSGQAWGERLGSIAMNHLFDFLIPIALAAVLITLCVGIYALFRGGDFGRSYSNKLMRLRVALQFLAVLVLVAAFWWRSH
jgi:nitrogen fixation-related uncharacterized protein